MKNAKYVSLKKSFPTALLCLTWCEDELRVIPTKSKEFNITISENSSQGYGLLSKEITKPPQFTAEISWEEDL